MTDSTHTANNISQFNRFLNNNTSFIYEKYAIHFPKPLLVINLKIDPTLESCLKFIYDIFSFQKYQSNKKLNDTLRKGLIENIESFVQQTVSKVEFTREVSVKLLRFCIENNDMFAVHYDRKNGKPKPESQDKQKILESQPQIKEQESPKQMVIEKNQQKQPEKLQESHFQKEQQKQSQPYNQQSKIEVNEQQKPIDMANQFECAQVSQVRPLNIQQVNKQLKTIFDFYCKQQQNVTPNTTFDIINHKCQTMSLGKFLYFAVAVNIVQSRDKAYSEARLNKKSVIALFKKFAEGQRQIDLKIFLKIMDEIYKNDNTVFNRMGLGQDGKNNFKFTENFKYFNLPFSTRDLTGREKSPQRIFVSKLTAHSGKIEEALRQELLARKEQHNNIHKSNQQSKVLLRNRAPTRIVTAFRDQTKENNKISAKETEVEKEEGQDLSFLSKLITHEDNDQIFLKDYSIPLPPKSINRQKVAGFGDNIKYPRYQSSTASVDKIVRDLTTRPRQTFALPLIKQVRRQAITQRKSLGIEKKTYKF